VDKKKCIGLLAATVMILSSCSSQNRGKKNDLKFNHLYVVVDAEIYNQFLTNDFVQNEFANSDMGMPNFQKIDNTAKTFYIRGENTYLELMGPENKFKEPVGAIGIGFSWDTQLPFTYNINDYLKVGKNNPPKFETFEFPWDFHDHKTVWYQASYTKAKSNNLSTWYSFYNPAFLSDLFKKNYTQYSNKDYLSKAYNPKKLLTDLVAVNLSCTKLDFDKIVNELKYLDSKIILKNGSSVTYQFQKFQLTIAPNNSASTSNVESITFKTKNTQSNNMIIEKIKIKNNDSKSIWEFH